MNWLAKIKWILGEFWTYVFQDSDFILGVEFVYCMYFKVLEYMHINWRNSLIAKNLTKIQDSAPYVVLLDTAKIHQAYNSYDKILAAGSTAVLGAVDTSAGWLAECDAAIKPPETVQDHVFNYTKTLFAGMDFTYSEKEILFYVNPATIGFKTLKKTDTAGVLHVYYVLFCRAKRTERVNDMVTGFCSPLLNAESDIVWDMHINGVTPCNMNRLLASGTNSVVAKNSGTIITMRGGSQWEEQGYLCASIDDVVYTWKKPTTTATCNMQNGAYVNAGDVIFGDLKVYNHKNTPSVTDVPGIKVRADAGELTAGNAVSTAYLPVTSIIRDMYNTAYDRYAPGDTGSAYAWKDTMNNVRYTNTESIIQDTTTIYKDTACTDAYSKVKSIVRALPLTGDSAVVTAYKQACFNNAKETSCPYKQVQATVNPYTFIVGLRKHSGIVVRIVTSAVNKLSAVLDCLRKHIAASSIISVYVRTDTDVAGITASSLETTAGEAAIAVDATVTVRQLCTEAHVVL